MFQLIRFCVLLHKDQEKVCHYSRRTNNPGNPNLEQLLSEFNRSLTLIVDKSLLIGNIVAKVKQICPVESVYIFLLDENTGKFKLQNEAKNKPVTLTNRSRLISWLSVNEKHLIISRHPDIVSYFPSRRTGNNQATGCRTDLPLKIMNQINGTIFLGKKTDGAPFTEQELNLLSILINQATFAIEHASLYEQQTERLKKMYRTDRLATLGELAARGACDT